MSPKPSSWDFANWVTLFCAAFVAGTGAIVLTGWAAGSATARSLGLGRYPMAPNTALLFVVLGGALLVGLFWPARRVARLVTVVAASGASLAGVVTLAGFVTGLNLDGGLFRSLPSFNAVPIGRMTPIPAACFALAGISLLLAAGQARIWATRLGIVIGLVGAGGLLGHVFMAPLPGGESVVPAAQATLLDLVALATALCAAARPRPWPLYFLIGSATLMIFLMDLLTPLDFTVWSLYLIPLLLSSQTREPLLPVALAVICTVLMVGGDLLTPNTSAPVIQNFNYSIGVMVMWATAILARKRMLIRAALQANEALFRALTDSTTAGICILQGTRLRFANSALERLTGYSADKLLEMDFCEAVHPDHRALVRQRALARQSGEPVPVRYEMKLRTLQGETRWVDFTAGLISYEGRTATLGTAIDITERKTAGIALRESEARYQRAEAATTDGLWERNLVTGEEYCSLRWLEMMGYAPDDAPGTFKDFMQLVHPEDRPLAMAEYDQSRRGNRPFALEMRLQRKDGTYLPVLSRGLIELDAKGEPARMTGTITDLTPRKQAEAALQLSEARFRRVVESDMIGIFFWNASGLLTDANDAFLRIVGYTRDDLLAGRVDWRKLTPPEYGPLDESNLRQMEVTGICPPFEKEYFRRDGTRMPVLLGGACLPGEAGGGVAFVLDITTRKQAETISACQTMVLGKIAAGAPLDETLTALLLSMEAFAPGMLCSILLLDADGVHVRHGAAPSLPEAFYRAIDGQPIGPRAGSCGTAAFRREAVIVEDIAADPLWADYRELALGHGLRACWSTPIFNAEQQVLGTFAIYYRQPGQPTALHRRCIELATSLAAIAISRHRSETALRVSVSRHRRLIESNIIGVMIANIAGGISEANDLFLGMIGCTREEMQAGRVRWDTITPPEWKVADRRAVEELKATGVCTPYEKEYLHKDGHRVPIFIAVAMLEGTPGDGICLIENLTARKQAEAALLRQHTLLSTLLESSNDAIFAKDLAGRYLIANSACRQAMGRTTAEIIGRTDEELIPPERARLYRATDEQVLAEHRSLSVEASSPTSGGMRHWLANKAPWRGEDGSIIGVIGVIHDLTAHKQNEAALRESQDLFRKVFEEGGLGMSMTSLGDRRFLNVNGALCRMLGYTEAELMSLGFAQITHPDHRAEDEAALRDLLAGRIQKHKTEKRYLHKNGGEVWATRTLTLIRGADGAFSYGLAITEDITERKRAAEAVQESQTQLRALLARLQRTREEERTRVAREIHDELGQLLTGLKMDVRWLEKKLSEPHVPPAFNPLLERAVEASALADATLATVQKIALELRPGTLDRLGLEAALREEARRFQHRTGIPCTVAVAESWPVLPPTIAGELFYIAQEALTNVARHARAQQVEIELRTAGGTAVLEVRDDGVGLPAEEQSAHHSLGLIGMRERAVQCGGTISFTRSAPHGTTVTVRVPAPSR